jgi:hypothetical protein
VGRVHAFVTLAMSYTGVPGPNAVKFMAYDTAGNLTTTAQLDSTGNNVSIPNSCINCHGIDAFYSVPTATVSANARFLPFDPFNFKYSTAAGFTSADQAGKLRRLNQLLRAANPTIATAELIDGMYAPKFVTDPTAVANDSFVPAAWQTPSGNVAGASLYRGLVKVGCRTCHVSSVSDTTDFNARANFDAFIGPIRADVCGTAHTMPNAERPMKKLWESGARAYLVTGYGAPSYPDPRQACKP